MRKSASGSTEPPLAGRSRICPKEASTSYPWPRYLLIAFALAGDSTTTIFMKIQSVIRRYLCNYGGIGRIAGPEHGEGGPCCQIGPLRGRVRPIKWGAKETGLMQAVVVQSNMCYFRERERDIEVPERPALVNLPSRPACPATRASDYHLAACPVSFARREYCRANQNRCDRRTHSLYIPAPTIFFVRQCVHRATADGRP